jgi:hypothetical protein
MNLGKLLKAMLAITAAGLLLASQTSCDERRSQAPGPQTATSTVPAAKPAASAAPVSGRVIEVSVTNDGYVPNEIHVKKGEPVVLRVTRKTDETCATDLLIKDTDVKVALPLMNAVDIPYTPTKTGEIKFGCAMNMMVSGVLVVDES